MYLENKQGVDILGTDTSPPLRVSSSSYDRGFTFQPSFIRSGVWGRIGKKNQGGAAPELVASPPTEVPISPDHFRLAFTEGRGKSQTCTVDFLSVVSLGRCVVRRQ